jgi:DNA polymerase III delta prime subunit
MIIGDTFPEHFRPKNLKEMILPNRLRTLAKKYIEKGTLQNLVLFSRGAGYGKTSFAIALVKELGANLIFLKGSAKTGIDRIVKLEQELMETQTIDLLGTIDYSKQANLSFNYVVIIDEADQLSKPAQLALKNIIESYSDQARFIFTTNYIHKLDHHMKKRCREINFLFSISEQQEMLQDTLKLIIRVANEVNLEYESNAIPYLIKKTFPSIRDMLIALETIATFDDKLTIAAVDDAIKDVNIDELIIHMKSNDFGNMQSWVETHTHLINADFYKQMYYKVSKDLVAFKQEHPESNAPLEFLFLMDEYQYKHNQALDIMIQVSALCSKIMLQGWLK